MSTSGSPLGKIPRYYHFSIETQSRDVRWQFNVTQKRRRITFYLIFSTTLKDKMSSTFPIKGNNLTGLPMAYQGKHNQKELRPGFEWDLLNSHSLYSGIKTSLYLQIFSGHGTLKSKSQNSWFQAINYSVVIREQLSRKGVRDVALGR